MQFAIIVIPLMMIIQIMKDLKWMDVFSRWMAPVTRALGMNANTSTTMVTGLVVGLAYGAGVMIQAVKEEGVSKRDVTIAFIFLSCMPCRGRRYPDLHPAWNPCAAAFGHPTRHRHPADGDGRLLLAESRCEERKGASI